MSLWENRDFVVLPLYSSRGGAKSLPERSGLNQWNAGGRSRQPGESYIPIPKVVHDLEPDFFPARDRNFDLVLPTGQTVSAKTCQADRKALMSSPNSSLNYWLYMLIDGNVSAYFQRFSDKRPYTYADLAQLGFDSVLVEKVQQGSYKLNQLEVGSFERWLRG
jgi:hypothetical protein